MRIKQLLESANVGGMSTSSVATAPSKAGKMQRRQGNLLAAEGSEEQVYKVVALDKSNALKKPTKLNVKASSLDEVFERLAINDWYPLEINGVEVINGKRLKQGVAEGLGKTIKRGMAGWGAFDKDKPADVVKRVKGQDTDTLKGLSRTGPTGKGSPAELQQKAIGRELKKRGEQGVAEGEKTMSRAAKGNEKYGKDGMKALAKAGREGASDKKLDAIRNKHDNYNEDSDPCWKDYKQIGMKKKGGKQVPNCVPKESAVAEVAPPGWEKTVKSMKKHDEIDNPYALAWSMKNKGYKSHKKESIKEGGVKEILMDLRTMSDEEFQSTYKMSKMQARSKLKEKPVEENKKGVRAVKHTVKPRNFVAKNAVQSGAGAHKDKKKAQKQGDTKHKNKEPAYESRLWAALDRRIIK